MKQKTVIQIWGTQGGGKSGTVKLIREELIINYINPGHLYAIPLPSGEINEVLTCAGYKIGVESMGDDLWYGNLNARLDNLFVTHSCDIIICTSRVHNNVAHHIKHLANTLNYRLLKATNYRGDEPPFVHDELNQLSARHIVLLVNQIITGII